jgi:hypothetical protein
MEETVEKHDIVFTTFPKLTPQTCFPEVNIDIFHVHYFSPCLCISNTSM